MDAGEHQNLLQWGMQNPQQDHKTHSRTTRTHWNCCVTPTGLGTQDSPWCRQRGSLTAGSWCPLTPCSWRGWFVDSSAVTSFGDVGFRSPPVWEPDPSCSAAPVNSGQGMRAAPAAEGELPGHPCRPHPAPLQPWKGPIRPNHPLL